MRWADDFPETPLAQIDWSVPNLFRVASIVILAVGVIQMVMMLSHYWWRIIPLRKEIGKTVVAPPVVWTFAYHILVAAIMGVLAIGMAQGIYFGAHATVVTYLGPPLFLALTVVVSQFLTFYSKTLNEEEWRHIHRKR